MTVPRAVPVAVDSRLPQMKAISGKKRPLRLMLMLSQIRPSIRPDSYISSATMPAKNQAISMMETISEDMP